MHEAILKEALSGNMKALARCISFIENEVEGYEKMLEHLPVSNVPVTGITGPPGAGKSTLTDQLINLLIQDNKRVAVLCIDPSSAFHHGAILGDRIRMSRWYDNKNVFIRSLAGKGALGGLSPKVIEITDLLKSSAFDHVIIETIGVGQNEIEIAGLADTTVVVLVPEGGDEIQTMKAGLMEIADIFVVNKGDRSGADTFVKYLRNMLAPAFSSRQQEVQVIKTSATKNEGIQALYEALQKNHLQFNSVQNKVRLYAEKAYLLISKSKMKDIDIVDLQRDISASMQQENFNLYSYLKKFKPA